MDVVFYTRGQLSIMLVNWNRSAYQILLARYVDLLLVDSLNGSRSDYVLYGRKIAERETVSSCCSTYNRASALNQW